jgi:hypothetical protein
MCPARLAYLHRAEQLRVQVSMAAQESNALPRSTTQAELVAVATTQAKVAKVAQVATAAEAVAVAQV